MCVWIPFTRLDFFVVVLAIVVDIRAHFEDSLPARIGLPQVYIAKQRRAVCFDEK